MKPTPTQLKNMLRTAINREQTYQNISKGLLNPQVVIMRERSEATMIAFEAVLDALNGDTVILNSFVKGAIS